MTPAAWVAIASFIGSLMGTAVIAGISYGKVAATLSAHGKWLQGHEDKLDNHGDRIVAVESKLNFLR